MEQARMTWTEHRRQELTQRLAALFKVPQVRFVFLPSAAAAPIKYFPEPALIERDLREFAPGSLRVLALAGR
jgi:hypothetical protein